MKAEHEPYKGGRGRRRMRGEERGKEQRNGGKERGAGVAFHLDHHKERSAPSLAAPSLRPPQRGPGEGVRDGMAVRFKQQRGAASHISPLLSPFRATHIISSFKSSPT